MQSNSKCARSMTVLQWILLFSQAFKAIKTFVNKLENASNNPGSQLNNKGEHILEPKLFRNVRI